MRLRELQGFFRRSLIRHEPYVCVGNGLCVIGPETKRRKSCPKCRHDKCLEVGMSKDAIKTGRYSYVKKSHDILEMIEYHFYNVVGREPEEEDIKQFQQPPAKRQRTSSNSNSNSSSSNNNSKNSNGNKSNNSKNKTPEYRQDDKESLSRYKGGDVLPLEPDAQNTVLSKCHPVRETQGHGGETERNSSFSVGCQLSPTKSAEGAAMTSCAVREVSKRENSPGGYMEVTVSRSGGEGSKDLDFRNGAEACLLPETSSSSSDVQCPQRMLECRNQFLSESSFVEYGFSEPSMVLDNSDAHCVPYTPADPHCLPYSSLQEDALFRQADPEPSPSLTTLSPVSNYSSMSSGASSTGVTSCSASFLTFDSPWVEALPTSDDSRYYSSISPQDSFDGAFTFPPQDSAPYAEGSYNYPPPGHESWEESGAPLPPSPNSSYDSGRHTLSPEAPFQTGGGHFFFSDFLEGEFPPFPNDGKGQGQMGFYEFDLPDAAMMSGPTTSVSEHQINGFSDLSRQNILKDQTAPLRCADNFNNEPPVAAKLTDTIDRSGADNTSLQCNPSSCLEPSLATRGGGLERSPIPSLAQGEDKPCTTPVSNALKRQRHLAWSDVNFGEEGLPHIEEIVRFETGGRAKKPKMSNQLPLNFGGEQTNRTQSDSGNDNKLYLNLESLKSNDTAENFCFQSRPLEADAIPQPSVPQTACAATELPAYIEADPFPPQIRNANCAKRSPTVSNVPFLSRSSCRNSSPKPQSTDTQENFLLPNLSQPCLENVLPSPPLPSLSQRSSDSSSFSSPLPSSASLPSSSPLPSSASLPSSPASSPAPPSPQTPLLTAPLPTQLSHSAPKTANGLYFIFDSGISTQNLSQNATLKGSATSGQSVTDLRRGNLDDNEKQLESGQCDDDESSRNSPTSIARPVSRGGDDYYETLPWCEFSECELDEAFESLRVSHEHIVVIDSNLLSEADIAEKEESFLGVRRLREEVFGKCQNLTDRDLYYKILDATGIDLDGRKEWMEVMAGIFNTMVRKTIRFFKSVPGFRDICQADKVVMSKSTFNEYSVLSFFRGLNPRKQLILDAEHSVVIDTEFLHKVFPEIETSLQAIFLIAQHLKKLELSLEEILILKAIVITSSDREQLQEYEKVDRLYWRLHCMLQLSLRRHHRRPMARYARLISVLTELRSVGALNSKNFNQASPDFLRLTQSIKVPLFMELICGINMS
ncbi:flocculation protein FLO11 [Aplysia californica]|uniref:Flocculation protein FLO11 n=1 Tax=Aplysia californica TaxID=6500 RepID=A0ABM1VXZ5_APLCA|nr:flocculation protein FLO11 [Aplysia californica]